MNLRKILVAYDGSELSKSALDEAKRQTKLDINSEIHIVTVVTPGISTNNTAIAGNLSMNDTETIFPLIDKLKQELKDAGYHAKMKIITDFSQRNPGVEICNYAEENDITLIVVGNRAQSNLKKLFLGSVSNVIVQRANCQVLVIK